MFSSIGWIGYPRNGSRFWGAVLSNIFGGIKILLDGQFRRGEWIKTPDIEGIVVSGIATTKVRIRQGHNVNSNKRMSVSTIKNSRMTNRRLNDYWR